MLKWRNLFNEVMRVLVQRTLVELTVSQDHHGVMCVVMLCGRGRLRRLLSAGAKQRDQRDDMEQVDEAHGDLGRCLVCVKSSHRR